MLGDGWEVLESSLRLSGWSQARRVLLVREIPALAPVGPQRKKFKNHIPPASLGFSVWGHGPAPRAGRIAFLVTTLEPKLYAMIAPS